MPLAAIETWHYKTDLDPSPIEPSWIIEGNPEARSRLLSSSACHTAHAMIWSCTEGKFNWYYDLDETIMILEGSIVLEIDGMPPKRYGVGDVIFFRSGARAKWHAEGYVKKVALRPPDLSDPVGHRDPSLQQTQVADRAERTPGLACGVRPHFRYCSPTKAPAAVT